MLGTSEALKPLPCGANSFPDRLQSICSEIEAILVLYHMLHFALLLTLTLPAAGNFPAVSLLVTRVSMSRPTHLG